MERFLCLSALLVIIHQTYCQEAAIVMYKYSTQDVEVFEQWMIEHSKSYDTIEEYEQRLSTFIENLEQIREHNSGNHSWKMGLNQFSDLNFEEFSLLYLGTPQNCSATKSQSVTGAIPPFRKDWREEGDYVTPVKNQGHCGSCWTFSTTGCLESATAIHGKDHQLYTLSEQQLVDCATKFDDFGCNGGLPSHAFEYVKYNNGLESEDDYPYTGKDSDCKFDPSKSKAFVRGVVNITQGDEDSIVGAVGTLNPVSVAFQVTGDFKNYKSGVYSNPTCGKSPSQVNHAVLAVGYDEDEISGKLYWIIKNSWGTDFGIQGYFYMERGSNMCGVATCASYPLVP